MFFLLLPRFVLNMDELTEDAAVDLILAYIRSMSK